MNKLLQKAFLFLLCAGWFAATGGAVTVSDPLYSACFNDFSSITTGATAEVTTIVDNGVTLTLPAGVIKNEDGSVSLNGLSGAKVSLAAQTQTIAVVLDLAQAPVAPANPSDTSYTLLVNFDSVGDIAAAYTGSGIRGAWNSSLNGRSAATAWTPEATKILAATSSSGGTTIRVKDNTDTNKWQEGGLKSSSNRYQNIDLGPTLTLKGIYVYTSYETNMPSFSEAEVVTEDTTIGAEDEPLGVIEIPEAVTVTVTDSAKITASTIITGEGTLVCQGFAPAHSAGLTWYKWAGTVELKDVSGATNLDLSMYGNASSTIALNNVVGCYLKNAFLTIPSTVDFKGSFEINNGYSDDGTNRYYYNFTGPIKGSGTFKFTGGSSTDIWCFSGEISQFTGTIHTGESGRKRSLVFRDEPLTGSIAKNDKTVYGENVITFMKANATYTGSFAGTGKLKVASGMLTLNTANTYSGGTEIATGAKLTITNAGAIGTEGAITGAGELICDGVLPANKTGLTTGTPADGETPASGWLGTVELDTLSDYCNFATYGNLYSTVRVNGASGYTAQSGSNGTQMATNVEIGENGLTINNGNSGNLSIVTGDLSGTGTITMSASSAAPRLVFVKGTGAFTGDITVAQASGSATKCGAVIFGEASNGNTSNYTLTLGTITDYNPSGKIVVSPNASAKVVGTWTAYQGVHAFGALSGTGTIASALTFADGATLDVTAGVLTVTGAVTLPSAMTVKIAEAPAAGTAVAIVKASFAETGVVDNATVTVMVGDTPAEGTYQLIKTPTALLLDHVPAASMDVIASTEALTESFATLGDASGKGIQVDLDAADPYAPGWVWGQSYALKSLFLKKRSNSADAANAETTVSVVDADNPSVVIATSTSCETTDEGYRFIFTDAAILDASKTYQFRFSKVVGVRGVSVGEDQSASLYLDANLNTVIPSYVPLYTLTAERIVDNSPIVSGGDEVLAVATVPEKIRLNTATFGYGMHTVLQYTGEGSPDWSQMQVEGLPEGAEVVTDGNNWGFVNHTLTVWPIGDSITAGLVKYNEGGSANWHVAGGYRLPLYQFLNQAGYGVNYIGTSLYPTSQTNDSCSNSCEDRDIDSKILKAAGLLHHEGHSGTTLDQLYTRFKKATVQTILASQGTPDVITLHLGTNDFGGGNSVDTVKTEMKQLLYVLNGAAAEGYTSEDTPLYPNAKVAVAKIIPRSDRDLTSSLDEFNTWLETYAAACPEKLVLVDLGMDTSYTLLRHDGLHPSPEGYKQMARGWFAAIEKTIAPVKATETIASVDARVANRVTVTTNKAIDTSLTQTWTLDNGATVSAATIADDKRTVTLTVEGVVAGAEYILTATNLFAADDSVTKTFTTTDIHTPTTDVEDTSATESATKLDGVTKAAEWTTFAGFATGYTSPIGYMPESGRAWQLDVRGTNEPTVKDGVLSLNGAPLTVNFVDGHIGNTSSTYTMVMTVSNLSANDVIVTESMTSITVNGSVEGTPSGTPAPDAIQLTVKDANTLLWGTTEIPVEVDLTDDEPDTIALSGKWVNGDDSYSIAVNGGAKTNLPVSGASQIIRGSWSIGALSTAEEDTGSSMKLYRLSFYEGAAEVTMPATEYVIPVDTYDTWTEAVTGLKITDTTLPVTLNFTAADQTFTFDNAGEVSLATLSVQGEAGTLAKTGAGTVTVSEETQIATTLTVAGQIQLNGITIEDDATLAISDYRVIGTPIDGAGTLSVSNATLTQALDAKLVAETWTGTVVLNAIQDSLLDVAKLVNAASNLTLDGEVEAYVYNCSMNQLTLNGSFRGINGTSNSELVQTATVAKLVGEGTLYGHATANGATAHVRLFFADVTDFAGSVALPDEKDCGTTILFGPGETTAGGKVVVSTQIAIASGKAWTAKNGFDITTNAMLDLNGNTLTASALTGSGCLVDNAEVKGSLAIDGTTDFAGVLEIGTLQVNADASFTLSGATDSTVSSLSGNGTLTLNNANSNKVAHLVLTGTSDYSGAICLDGNTELKLSGVEQESIKTGATLNVLGSLQLKGAVARLNTLDAGFSDALVKIASGATLITGGASGRQNANVEMADGAVLDVRNQSLGVNGFKLASETAQIEVIAGEIGALLSASKGVDALAETNFLLSAESPILSGSVTEEMLHFYVMPGYGQVALVQVEAELDGLSEADKQAIFWTVYTRGLPVREITNRDVPAIFVADYGSGYFMTTTSVTEDGVDKMDVAYAVNFGISEITAHKDAEDNILFNITATVEPYQTGAAIAFQQNVEVVLLKGNEVVATQTIDAAGVSEVCFENVPLLPTEAGTVTLTVRATSASE